MVDLSERENGVWKRERGDYAKTKLGRGIFEGKKPLNEAICVI